MEKWMHLQSDRMQSVEPESALRVHCIYVHHTTKHRSKTRHEVFQQAATSSLTVVVISATWSNQDFQSFDMWKQKTSFKSHEIILFTNTGSLVLP